MKIPAFWAKAEANEVDDAGQTHSFACWRWSDQSEPAARQSAREAAERIVRGLMAGQKPTRYTYGQVALREEVVQKITDAQGELTAAVTQNYYGSLVLNTDRVMFIDLDFPNVGPGEQLRYFFARLFRRPVRPPDVVHEETMRTRLDGLVQNNPSWSARVYRTFAGMRVLATHALFDPAADETLSLLRSVGSDPLYIQLCKAQQCFRARLTPKPWRCGATEKMIRWPREGADEKAEFERWQEAYGQLQAAYATCKYLGTIGTQSVHPQAVPIVELHDHMTRCLEPLPLA